MSLFSSSSGSNWSLSLGVGAAVAASACCTIPLVLVSLGVGGAWLGTLTALAPYRWIFVGVAVGTLGYAGYNEWQLSRRPGCNCETIFSSPVRRTLLGVGVLAVGILLVSPWLVSSASSGVFPETESVPKPTTTTAEAGASGPTQQIVLTVGGMTCAACPQTVQAALSKVGGVSEVEVTLEPPRATVRISPSTVSVEDLMKATEGAGYPSRPTSDS